MAKTFYKYNPKTLSYERAERSVRERFLRGLLLFGVSAVVAVSTLSIAYTFFDSPKEQALKEENARLQLQYDYLNNRLDKFDRVLDDVQQRDDDIYRVIFEAEPIPNNLRKAGTGGGANRYRQLEGFKNSQVMIETTKRLDKISKQLYIQSKSFDEVFEMAKKKEAMLAAIPAIQPISNKDLTRFSSGFGYRVHPIYKVTKFHAGIDFTAPTGTEIYATGSGIVERADSKASGFGKHVVVNHGYGYKTRYAHMSRFAVRPGQKVKRGDVLGYVGNTGLSSGPHLHYEVEKGNTKIDPINYFFDDLSPEEYDRMIDISSRTNQSFD
ncbi:MAG: M23 family metallopeptidase [Bacteroidota bacterium]